MGSPVQRVCEALSKHEIEVTAEVALKALHENYYDEQDAVDAIKVLQKKSSVKNKVLQKIRPRGKKKGLSQRNPNR